MSDDDLWSGIVIWEIKEMRCTWNINDYNFMNLTDGKIFPPKILGSNQLSSDIIT